jgi:hypothetical protein
MGRVGQKRGLGTSQYPGVSFHKSTNRWRAKLIYKGQKFHLGTFKNEEDAAKVYEKKLAELNADSAKCTNEKPSGHTSEGVGRVSPKAVHKRENDWLGPEDIKEADRKLRELMADPRVVKFLEEHSFILDSI